MNNVLVMMATFNGESYIEKQIHSIFKQKSVNIDLLISDDGSTDNTLSVIKKMQKIYSNIRLIHNPYKSNEASFSLNFLNCFLNAKLNYDYYAISDQDDIFKNQKFIESIKQLKKFNADLLSSAVQCFDQSKKLLKQESKITNYDYLFEGAGQGCTFVMTSNFFTDFKSCIKPNISLLKKFYYHDWLVYLFARVLGFKWIYLDQPLTEYRIHNKNNTGNKYSIKGILYRLKKIVSPWYLEQIYLASKISHQLNKKHFSFNSVFDSQIILKALQGRRKYSDRAVSVIFIIISILLNLSLRK